MSIFKKKLKKSSWKNSIYFHCWRFKPENSRKFKNKPGWPENRVSNKKKCTTNPRATKIQLWQKPFYSPLRTFFCVYSGNSVNPPMAVTPGANPVVDASSNSPVLILLRISMALRFAAGDIFAFLKANSVQYALNNDRNLRNFWFFKDCVIVLRYDSL